MKDKTIILIAVAVIVIAAVITCINLVNNDKSELKGSANKFEKPTKTYTSASTTAYQIVNLNYNRQYLEIINIGTSTAWIQLGTSTDYLAVGQGIPLLALTTTTPNIENSRYVIDADNLYFGPIQDIATNYTRLYITEK